MPRVALALVPIVLATACTSSSSRVARRTGMALAIGGVAGIVGSVVATRWTPRGEDALLAFEVVSGVGIITFAAAELSGPGVTVRRETLEQRHHRWAKILTEHAAGAARNGNCARVRKFEPRVRVYDPDVHDFVFMRDPEIVRCLTPTPPTAPPEDAAPADDAAPPAAPAP